MAHPTRAKQIEKMAELLDSDKWDDVSLKDLATYVVDSFHKYLGIRENPMPMHVGEGFKVPWFTATKYVAWEDGQRAWLVSENNKYGWFCPLDHPLWLYAEESPDRRRDKTTPRPGSPGTNEIWSVGDRLSLKQREDTFIVLATGGKCALVESLNNGSIYSDSNENLEKYYRRERKALPPEEELL